MHSESQTAAVTIISCKPLSDLNFARYTGHYGSYMPSPPLGSISPWLYVLQGLFQGGGGGGGAFARPWKVGCPPLEI